MESLSWEDSLSDSDICCAQLAKIPVGRPAESESEEEPPPSKFPFSCPDCDKRYASLYTRRYHWDQQHSG